MRTTGQRSEGEDEVGGDEGSVGRGTVGDDGLGSWIARSVSEGKWMSSEWMWMCETWDAVMPRRRDPGPGPFRRSEEKFEWALPCGAAQGSWLGVAVIGSVAFPGRGADLASLRRHLNWLPGQAHGGAQSK